MESSRTRSFSVRWIDGWLNGWVDGWMKRPAARGLTIRQLLEGFLGVAAGRIRSAATYMGHVCVCARMWTWWQIAPLRLEHVWNGSGTGSGSATRVLHLGMLASSM